MSSFKNNLKSILFENFSYKLVALFIALILWVTVLGKRDFVLTKNINIEIKTADNVRVVAQTTDQIKVRISGPRPALKKFTEKNSSTLVFDLSDRNPGIVDIDVPINNLEIPVGVKLLNVRPNMIRVELEKK